MRGHPRLDLAWMLVVLVLGAAAGGRVSAATPSAGPVRLGDADGRVLVEARPGPGAVTIVDGRGQVLGTARIEADRVKLRDAAGVERWKVKRKDYGAEVEDGAGQRLYRVRFGTGGEWKLEDAGKSVLLRGKPGDDAVTLRDGRGATVARVKRHGTGLVVDSAAGRRTFEVSGTTDARAAAWFAVERFSLAERTALWTYFAHVSP